MNVCLHYITIIWGKSHGIVIIVINTLKKLTRTKINKCKDCHYNYLCPNTKTEMKEKMNKYEGKVCGNCKHWREFSQIDPWGECLKLLGSEDFYANTSGGTCEIETKATFCCNEHREKIND